MKMQIVCKSIFIGETDRQTGQRTDSIGRTVLQTVAQKPQILLKQNWNQLLLVAKANALKQQISNFCPQILSTEAASFYIYDKATA